MTKLNDAENINKVFAAFDEHKQVLFMDAKNVCGVIISNKKTLCAALSVLDPAVFFKREDLTQGINPVPPLKYTQEEKITGVINTCKFSNEYMSIILELVTMANPYGACRFYMLPDYPLTVECAEFGLRIILAPRVDNDD